MLHPASIVQKKKKREHLAALTAAALIHKYHAIIQRIPKICGVQITFSDNIAIRTEQNGETGGILNNTSRLSFFSFICLKKTYTLTYTHTQNQYSFTRFYNNI